MTPRRRQIYKENDVEEEEEEEEEEKVFVLFE